MSDSLILGAGPSWPVVLNVPTRFREGHTLCLVDRLTCLPREDSSAVAPWPRGDSSRVLGRAALAPSGRPALAQVNQALQFEGTCRSGASCQLDAGRAKGGPAVASPRRRERQGWLRGWRCAPCTQVPAASAAGAAAYVGINRSRVRGTSKVHGGQVVAPKRSSSGRRRRAADDPGLRCNVVKHKVLVTPGPLRQSSVARWLPGSCGIA